ncbi:hypothetical protein DMR_32630 [Solidesulfovibrio magneticus RS-1]|uniref:Uncharacterized protein n=1 Tax=Solidesulfovibrio magneticus (strain ATCC 700980 / DSM 13731 / RS-1) TaxID=573370 RepID=C4XJK7_SOLM1|nr:hypothetical protein DMR_32630 [Solidesulfovibrio magneticus RS-1]
MYSNKVWYYLGPPSGLEGEDQSMERRLTDLLFKILIAEINLELEVDLHWI